MGYTIRHLRQSKSARKNGNHIDEELTFNRWLLAEEKAAGVAPSGFSRKTSAGRVGTQRGGFPGHCGPAKSEASIQ